MSTIIFLGGVSSAGKSSVARVLQSRMEQPVLHVQLDGFENMMPDRSLEGGPFDWMEMFPKVLDGFPNSVTALAHAGNNLTVDHIMVSREGWRSSLAQNVRLLTGYRVYFIGITCSTAELELREKNRGDRLAGTAARQLPRVHTHNTCDLIVYRSEPSSELCGLRILDWMSTASPTAA